MGSCNGKEPSMYEEFNVTNINDEHKLVHSGIMFVTETDLIYIDKKSHEKWEWPLKYLRRYGCEGPVFSFEAGRKCPTGEGLYAFNCKRATSLFNKVARNISQGNLEPTEPELPPERNPELPFPPKQTAPSNIPNGITRAPSTSIAPIPISSVPPTSIPPVSLSSVPPPPPPTSIPSNQNGNGPEQLPHPQSKDGNYLRLEFDKDADNKPLPVTDQQINYSKINMKATMEFSRLKAASFDSHGNGGMRRQTTGNITSKKRSKGGSRSSSTSSNSSLNADQQGIRLRSLNDEYSRNMKRGSAPDIRNLGQRTSPPLLPETVKETPAENDTDPQKSISEPNYTNISVGVDSHQQQHTYSNMTIEAAAMSEQNYANLKGGVVDDHNYTNVSVNPGPMTTAEGQSAAGLPQTRPSVSTLDSDQHNYSNITIEGGVAAATLVDTSEHNYTNINIGGADEGVSRLSNSSLSAHQQSNYQNLIPGQGLVSSTPMTTPTQRYPPSSSSPDPGNSPSFTHTRSHTFNYSHTGSKLSSSTIATNSNQTLPNIKGGGDTMQTYIELEMNPTSSYVELQLDPQQTPSTGLSSSLTTTESVGERQRSQSAIVTPSSNPISLTSVGGVTSTTGEADTQDTLYKELNFKAMEAIHAIHQERQHQLASDTPPVHTESEKDQKKHKSKK